MSALGNLQQFSPSKHLVQTQLPLQPTATKVSLSRGRNRAALHGKLTLVHASTCAATFYDILELSPDVGLPDIKKAYRQLARRYHPDVCPPSRSEESTRMFIEIQEAYETLSDPRRRAVYDHAVAMVRGSATTGRMPWSPMDMDGVHWRSQWEHQLFEFRLQSSMKAQNGDSWSARVRRQHGL